MSNPLGASWKPKVVAIVTAIGTPGIYFILTTYFKVEAGQASQISLYAMAVLVAAGFATAKQDGVSNSPNPVLVAQEVVPQSIVEPHPSVAAPVPMAKPVATVPGHILRSSL